MPVFDESGHKLGYRNMMSDLDEQTLRAIAGTTGGRYFRAMDSGTVDAAFAAIDRERKIEFDATSTLNVQEFYAWAAWPGMVLVFFGFFLAPRSAALWAVARAGPPPAHAQSGSKLPHSKGVFA